MKTVIKQQVHEKMKFETINPKSRFGISNRENVLRALRRDNPQRVPFEFVLCPSHIENFRRKTGCDDYQEYFGFPIRYVELNKTRITADLSKYYGKLPPNATPLHWNPEWGIMGINGSVGHFQEMLHPMANLKTIDELTEYPFPDFNAGYRWDGVETRVGNLVTRDLIAVGFMQMTLFEVCWYMRGMDNFMMDLLVNVEFAETLMDRITEIRVGMASRYAECGVDILMLGDDVATQDDMMFAPQMWRNLIKPRLAKVIKAAKDVAPKILIFYHCDGNPKKIIPDLIEIGIDILNPIQPECMDPIELKHFYGEKLSFWGTVGTQTTMPFSSPDEVKMVCKKMIKSVGRGGGLLLAPTHMLEPDVPWSNVQAFVDAVQEFGKYQ